MKEKTPAPVRVGLLLSRLFKFYNHEAVEGMVAYVADRPWIQLVDCRFLDLSGIMPKLKALRADALIMGLKQGEYQEVKRWLPSGCPSVNIHPDVLSDTIPSVRIHQQELAAASVQYFVRLGYHHMACLGTPGSTSFADFIQYFAEQATAFGVETCADFRIHLAEDYYSDGHIKSDPAFETWLLGLPRPVAITTSGGYTGAYLNRTAQRLGLRVPDDIAILSHSDDEACLFTTPPLAAFRSVGIEIGRHALSILDATLQRKEHPTGAIEIAPPEVIERRSTGYSSGMDANVKRALRFLRAHACEGISVADIGNQVSGISRCKLYSEIRRYTGLSPAAEIRRLRLARACHLLAHTNQDLSSIAEQCGFTNAPQFSLTFRKQLQCPPRAYRLRCQQQ